MYLFAAGSLYAHAWMCRLTRALHARMHVYMYMYVWTDTHMFLQEARIWAKKLVCMHACVYVCVCVMYVNTGRGQRTWCMYAGCIYAYFYVLCVFYGVYMCVRACVFVYVGMRHLCRQQTWCVYVSMGICMYLCMPIYIACGLADSTFLHTRTYMHGCGKELAGGMGQVSMHTYMNTRAPTHTHTHIHKYENTISRHVVRSREQGGGRAQGVYMHMHILGHLERTKARHVHIYAHKCILTNIYSHHQYLRQERGGGGAQGVCMEVLGQGHLEGKKGKIGRKMLTLATRHSIQMRPAVLGVMVIPYLWLCACVCACVRVFLFVCVCVLED
jgi:hypothetical protein